MTRGNAVRTLMRGISGRSCRVGVCGNARGVASVPKDQVVVPMGRVFPGKSPRAVRVASSQKEGLGAFLSGGRSLLVISASRAKVFYMENQGVSSVRRGPFTITILAATAVVAILVMKVQDESKGQNSDRGKRG